jgi:hypothetical protein
MVKITLNHVLLTHVGMGVLGCGIKFTRELSNQIRETNKYLTNYKDQMTEYAINKNQYNIDRCQENRVYQKIFDESFEQGLRGYLLGIGFFVYTAPKFCIHKYYDHKLANINQEIHNTFNQK